MGERCGGCGEINSGGGCGEGPTRKEGGPALQSAFCSRNAHDRNVLVRRPQSGLTGVPVQGGVTGKLGEGCTELMIFCACATRVGSSVWSAGLSGLSGSSG